MVNSWSLLFDELNMTEHSKYYYEYDRNDPDRKNPFAKADDGEDVILSSNISSATSTDWNDFWGAADTVPMSMFEGGEDVISFDIPELPEAPKNDNGFWKYHEDVILKEVRDYLGGTYNAHYASSESKTQTLDLIESVGDAEPFCRSNAIKYLSRFGKKGGKSKQDILKAIHYCILLYHFAGLCNENTQPYETF